MARFSVDALARGFGSPISRRRGVAAAIAAALAGGSASARVQIPPTCRAVGMQCASGDACCSGRCIPKEDGTSRCARKTSNRKTKKLGSRNSGGSTPVPPAMTCTVCPSGCEYGAIESAVEFALSGATILVGPGIYSPVRINSTFEGSILIQKDHTLAGCDPDNPPIIDAGGYGNGMFTILVNASTNSLCDVTPINVEIRDVIIKNGSDRNALYTQGNANVTLTNVEVLDFTLGGRPIMRLDANGTHSFDGRDFHDNTSGTGTYEGGIVGITNHLLILSGTTTIRDNTVPESAYGGGVFVAGGTLEIRDDASITGNGTPAAGGGVCLTYGGSLTNGTASTVSNNVAQSCNTIYDNSNFTCLLA